MFKRYRAVTSLIVMLFAALWAATASAQSVNGNGELPPDQQVFTGSVASAATLFTKDAGGYRSFAMQLTSIGSSNTLLCEQSNDRTTWITLNLRVINSLSLDPLSSFSPSLTNLYTGDIVARYFRCRVSGYGSGTVSAVVRMVPQASAFGQTVLTSNSGVPNVVGGNVASGSADSGNPVKIGGRYNATPPTLADGQRGDLQVNTRGELIVGINTTTGGDGVSASYGVFRDATGNNRIMGAGGYNFNGSTIDREFTCPLSAVVNVAAAATTQIVALAASQIIRVCSFVISGDTIATTATFVYGTGANCGTGTTSLTGAMRLQDEGHIAITGMNGSLLRTPASNALCLTAVAGAVTGFVTYAQY